MPIIKAIPTDPRAISISVERDAIRSNGIHLSSIIKNRLITAGIGRKTTGRPFTPQEQNLIWQRGFLWERMVAEFCDSEEWLKHQIEQSASKHFRDGDLETNTNKCIVRPGECKLDGIYMTPDALHMGGYHIEEWKATAIRFKGFDIEARRPEWLWQTAAYAQVFGMTKAMIRIWHVSDNVINSLSIEWTPAEIQENWKNLLDHWNFMKERALCLNQESATS